MKIRITLLSLLIFVTMGRTLLAYDEANLKQLLETNSCEHCNLNGAILRKLNFNNASLNGANLSGADFSDSDLTGADLTDTYLYQTNFVRTKLTKANFFGSRMTGADLTSANLYGANIFLGEISQVAPVPSRMLLRKGNGFLLRAVGDYREITSFDLNQPLKYMTSKSGLLYRSKGNRYGAYVRHYPDLLAAFEKNKLSEATDSLEIPIELFMANKKNQYVQQVLLIAAKAGGDAKGIARYAIDLENAVKKSTTASMAMAHTLHFLKGVGAKRSFHVKTAQENLQIPIDEWGKHHWEKHGQYELRYLPTLPDFEVVLDLNNNPLFIKIAEVGLLSVATRDNLIYLSYTIRGECSDDDSCRDKMFLVVDEYKESMEKIRTIIKIKTRSWTHVAGTLVFDAFGKLYVSVGAHSETDSQDRNSLLGKILRIDVSQTDPEPEVIAYGLRNPWKISIDSKNRMFIGDCGEATIESVYLLDDLYRIAPYSLGWPAFEGTKQYSDYPLRFEDTLAPIYEYRHHQKGACVIGGYFIDELNAYLFGDYFGKVRLLKKLEEHWQEIYIQNTPNVLSFGMNANNNNIYLGGWNKVYRLVPLNEEIKRYPSIVLCDTTMPDGMLSNRDCD